MDGLVQLAGDGWMGRSVGAAGGDRLDAIGRGRVDGWVDVGGCNWLATNEREWPRPDGWMDGCNGLDAIGRGRMDGWMQLACDGLKGLTDTE